MSNADAAGPAVRIDGFRPRRPWFPPGAEIVIEIDLMVRTCVTVQAHVELLDLDAVVAWATVRFRLRPGRAARTVRFTLPAMSRHGYGLRLGLTWTGGSADAVSAVEALDGWWESPRHAAITRFGSASDTAAAVRALRDWHVTVVQLYDWMYRHYRYEPPHGSSFTDTLGQRVSHEAVRAGVKTGHGVGIASLAYGSVYGAEREYVDAHPDERVFDSEGRPLSLGETFYINDIRPGSPWRRRLLDEYARAVRRFSFDGIHMDTYGPPHHGFGADGEPIDFADLYPGLIADGAEAVARARPGGRVLFNCVEGFPLGSVATAPSAALYLELWPPAIAYADVVAWIDRARGLGEGRAVIIAAYISALRRVEGSKTERGGAVEAAVLLSSVIAAAGGYHHVLAEDDRLLVEGYYPEARPLDASEREELRAAWAFTARYVHLLSDPGSVVLPVGELEVLDGKGDRVPVSETPSAGAVWVRRTQTPGGLEVLSLVDLLDQADDRWDEIRTASPRRSDLAVRFRWGDTAGAATVAMSPWTNGGEAAAVEGGRLPVFRRWIVLAPSRATPQDRPS